MKIIILGSQGFIGSHLVDFFLKEKHDVVGCDLIESPVSYYNYQKVSILSSDFDTLFSTNVFDVCINASGSGNVGYSIVHPLNDYEANTYSVAKVLDTIRKFQPDCKYVHISSAAVYGNPAQLPIKEMTTLAPLSPYGYHKLMSEQLCKEYSHLYNLPVAIIRPFSVYGNGLKKQLLWDICSKLKTADSVCLYGTGDESRDFIHINELAELTSIIIKKSEFQCDIYNAAAGKEITIKQIAKIFTDYFRGAKQITFSGEKKEGDPINWKADIDRLLKLGFSSTIDINAGVNDYIKWYNQ